MLSRLALDAVTRTQGANQALKDGDRRAGRASR